MQDGTKGDVRMIRSPSTESYAGCVIHLDQDISIYDNKDNMSPWESKEIHQWTPKDVTEWMQSLWDINDWQVIAIVAIGIMLEKAQRRRKLVYDAVINLEITGVELLYGWGPDDSKQLRGLAKAFKQSNVKNGEMRQIKKKIRRHYQETHQAKADHQTHSKEVKDWDAKDILQFVKSLGESARWKECTEIVENNSYEGRDFGKDGYDVEDLLEEDNGRKMHEICAFTIIGRLAEIGSQYQRGGSKRKRSKLGTLTIFHDDEVMVFNESLGRGFFGSVYLAQIDIEQDNKGFQKVAVKCIQDNRGDIMEVLKEAQLMDRIPEDHPHVIKFFGCCTFGDNTKFMDGSRARELIGKVCMLNEYCERGSLDKLHKDIDFLSPQIFNKTVSGMLSGLLHLHRQSIVHRDIACRNILMRADMSVVIGDYGLSRKIDEKALGYVHKGKKANPISWPPESWTEGTSFTFFSDVWMVGVAIWELLNKGRQIHVEEIKRAFAQGKNPYQIGFDLVVPPYAQPLMEMCLKMEDRERKSPYDMLRWMDKRGMVPPEVKATIPDDFDFTNEYWKKAVTLADRQHEERKENMQKREAKRQQVGGGEIANNSKSDKKAAAAREGKRLNIPGGPPPISISNSSELSSEQVGEPDSPFYFAEEKADNEAAGEEKEEKEEEEEEDNNNDPMEKKFSSLRDIKNGMKVRIISSVAEAAKLIKPTRIGFNPNMVPCCGTVVVVEQSEYPSRVKAGKWWWPLNCLERVTKAEMREMKKKAAETKTKLSLEVGTRIDALDVNQRWLEAVVKAIEPTRVRVHFPGFDDNFDEWINLTSDRIHPYGVKTGSSYQDTDSMSKDQLRMLKAATQVFSGDMREKGQRDSSRSRADDPMWPPSGVDLSSIRDGTPIQYFLMRMEVSLRRIAQLANPMVAARIDYPRFCAGGLEAERQDAVLNFLPQAEGVGIYIRSQILDLWQGERDEAALCDGLPAPVAALMRCVLRTTEIHEARQKQLKVTTVRKLRIKSKRSLSGVYTASSASGNQDPSSEKLEYKLDGFSSGDGKIPTLKWDKKREDWGLTDSKGISVARIKSKSSLPPSGDWKTGAVVTYLDGPGNQGKENSEQQSAKSLLEQVKSRYAGMYNIHQMSSIINKLKHMDFTDEQVADAANRYAFEYDDMLNYLIGYDDTRSHQLDELSEDQKRRLRERVQNDPDLNERQKQEFLRQLGEVGQKDKESGVASLASLLSQGGGGSGLNDETVLKATIVHAILNDSRLSREQRDELIGKIPSMSGPELRMLQLCFSQLS
eukprot:jgi/Bigna1/84936/estExt_fgenesh1_pg.C_10413